MSHAAIEKQSISHTFLIVFNALVVNLTRINSPIISECNRLCWTFGIQVRRVLCFEKGTLFPYCFILPWNKPCWDCLKGWDTTSHNALLGNIGYGGNGKCVIVISKLYICAYLPLTSDFLFLAQLWTLVSFLTFYTQDDRRGQHQ